MLPLRQRRLIGVAVTMASRIKPEYRFGKEPNMDMMVFIEIRKNRRFGARAEIFLGADLQTFMHKNVSKKARERFSKRLSKIKDYNKPVDTSKWVKPDKESLINELVKNLFLLEIMDYKDPLYNEAHGKADILYSIIHSHSPRNPQSLTGFAMSEPFSMIQRLMKSKEEKMEMQISFPSYGVGSKKNWFSKSRETEKARSMYQKWKSECLSKMIIEGKLHHHI